MTDGPGHLDLDELADVLADVRDDAHLRSCRPCGDRLAELAAGEASVTAALAALPAPPLPGGLSARLARALQEERRRELAQLRPLRRRSPTWLPAVAASAVLVMVGAVGWSLLGQSGPETAGVTSDAGGGGGSGSGQDSAAAPEAASELAVPRTATDWADEAARPAALARLLPAAGPSASSVPAVPSGDALDRLRDPAALAECLAGLPGGDDDVLAVDHAQYAGAPAVAVVQPADPGSVRVTVVGGGCSAGAPDVLTEVVLPRP